MSFDLKALVEVLNIDFIRGWINSAIESGIKSVMHLPHKLELRWDTDVTQFFKELAEGEFDPNGSKKFFFFLFNIFFIYFFILI